MNMKTKRQFFSHVAISLLAVMLTMVSCSKSDGGYEYYESSEYGYDAYGRGAGDRSYDGEGGGTGDNSQTNTQAGVVTAGEWCDLTHWDFWSMLMRGEQFSDKCDYWEFYTNNRIAVKVTDELGNALAGVNVKLLSDGNEANSLWEAVTDNHGLAECWLGLFQKTTDVDATRLRVSLNGETMEGHPAVCSWDSLRQSTVVNKYVLRTSKAPNKQADIAFIVDATGSMSDEINFLKQDLVDIINKVKSVRAGMKMRTAALFYRDEGDEYLTRHHDFTNGGNDYPEAVHTALERMLQNLSWDGDARTRIAFLILDAPAHHEKSVIKSLQQSIENCAKQGIKIIPVAASGVDKNTEFMLRFFANATGGTYVFLTDDSGVGESHIQASVGDYEVEQLNNLLIRLIKNYTE